MSAATDAIRESVALAYSALGALALHTDRSNDRRITDAFVSVLESISAIEQQADQMDLETWAKEKPEPTLTIEAVMPERPKRERAREVAPRRRVRLVKGER